MGDGDGDAGGDSDDGGRGHPGVSDSGMSDAVGSMADVGGTVGPGVAGGGTGPAGLGLDTANTATESLSLSAPAPMGHPGVSDTGMSNSLGSMADVAGTIGVGDTGFGSLPGNNFSQVAARAVLGPLASFDPSVYAAPVGINPHAVSDQDIFTQMTGLELDENNQFSFGQPSSPPTGIGGTPTAPTSSAPPSPAQVAAVLQGSEPGPIPRPGYTTSGSGRMFGNYSEDRLRAIFG